MNSNFNLGAAELAMLIAVTLIVLGLAPYISWRRGGSRARIVVAFLVSLIPYLGLILGMVVALTTKRPRGLVGDSTGGAQIEATAGPVSRQSGRAGGLQKIVFVAVLVLALIAIGGVGYYVGRQSVQGALPTKGPAPTWTDREIRATGTQNVGTLRCTYHMADGTVRVRESVIALSVSPAYNPFGTANPLGAQTPDCPSSP